VFRSLRFTCCLLESGSAAVHPQIDAGYRFRTPSAGNSSATASSGDQRSTCPGAPSLRENGPAPRNDPAGYRILPQFHWDIPQRRLCRGLGWRPNGPILRSTKSWQLATATCTERWRLCFSSTSIWKPSCISFMRLSRPPLLPGKASRACTEDVRIPELRRWLPPAAAQRKMNLVSTIRRGAIALGITAMVAVGVYLAVLLSLFDL
jgi:hypothetical protein